MGEEENGRGGVCKSGGFVEGFLKLWTLTKLRLVVGYGRRVNDFFEREKKNMKKIEVSPDAVYHRGPFLEGLSWIRKDGKQYHVRADGTPAYEERFDYVSSFFDGVAHATKDGESFLIDHNGKRVEP